MKVTVNVHLGEDDIKLAIMKFLEDQGYKVSGIRFSVTETVSGVDRVNAYATIEDGAVRVVK